MNSTKRVWILEKETPRGWTSQVGIFQSEHTAKNKVDEEIADHIRIYRDAFMRVTGWRPSNREKDVIYRSIEVDKFVRKESWEPGDLTYKIFPVEVV